MTVKSSQPGGLVSKVQYDGLGRTTKSITSDGGGDTAPGSSGNWADALTVTGDIVLKQSEYLYDENSNVILTATRQLFHDATHTGELGDPSSTSGTAKARVYDSAAYYDRSNRVIVSMNAGTNGGGYYSPSFTTVSMDCRGCPCPLRRARLRKGERRRQSHRTTCNLTLGAAICLGRALGR